MVWWAEVNFDVRTREPLLRLATWLPVGTILLVAVAALLIVFVPLAECISCHGTGRVLMQPHLSVWIPTDKI